MKKALLSVVAVGAIGGAVAGLLILGKKAGEKGALSAAELLPQDTIVFVELPDLKASGERWKQTGLYKIGQEQEVKAFLERPLALIPKNDLTVELRNLSSQVDSRQVFLGVTSVENANPRGVVGLRYAGGESARQALAAKLEKVKAMAREKSPAGKAALEQHRGYEIESFADGDTVVAGVFAGEWYFLANDIVLLKSVLDRMAGASDAPALAAVEGYVKSASALSGPAELRVFANVPRFRDQLLGMLAMNGQAMDQEQVDELKKIDGVLLTTAFDGELIRDTAYVHAPGLTKQPDLSGATDGLSAPDLPIHSVNIMNLTGSLPDASAIPGPAGAALQRLTSENIGMKEIAAAFGPELSFSMDITGRPEIPTNVTAVQVKDRAAAEKIVRTLLEGWSKAEADGTITWTSEPISAGALALSASVILTEDLLLLGLESAGADAVALKAALARKQSGGENLVSSEAYKAAFKSVQKPTKAAVYVDTRTLFERIYGMLRPMAMIYGAATSASGYVDLAKLPATETISKHLRPSVMSQVQNDEGLRVESAGTVTLFQGGLGLGAVVGVVAKVAAPMLQGMGGADAGGPAASPNAGGLQQLEDAVKKEAPSQVSPDAEDGENP